METLSTRRGLARFNVFTLTSYLLVSSLGSALPQFAPVALAAVTVTQATGGSAILSTTAGGSSYTSLTGPAIAEGALGDIGLGTIILNAPTGFRFNPGVNVTATRSNAGACGGGGSLQLNGGNSQTVTPTASTITVTVSRVSSGNNNCRATITFSNVRVQPTNVTPLASGDITKTGTSVINGVTSLGTLTEVNPSCRGKTATIFVTGGTVYGGPQDGTAYAGTLNGTSGDDVMIGTSSADTINGNGGNDTICGGGGNDGITTGAGNDIIDGEGGMDTVDAGAGSDFCFDAGSPASCESTDPNHGIVVIQKDAVPDDAQDFEFTGDINPDFYLDDDADGTLPNSRAFDRNNTSGSSNVDVYETAVAGWTLTAINCTDPTSDTTVDLGTSHAAIEVSAMEIVTCTFVNQKPAVCGNGIKEGTEECDDGNAVNTDACLNSCMDASCGDTYIETGVEECDDGNAVNTDACLNSCMDASCGDTYIESGVEECDDGNTDDDDGCSSACLLEHCGDGTTQTGEECDDGNSINTDACLNSCLDATCGDTYIQSGMESCDDGNLIDGDGCDSNCTATACGNGVVTSGESCDDGNLIDGDGCDSNCTATACGNGVVTSGESCDDGNLVNGDHCDSNCIIEICGNGVLQSGEACDDGAANSDSTPDACRATCVLPTCGDSTTDTGKPVTMVRMVTIMMDARISAPSRLAVTD